MIAAVERGPAAVDPKALRLIAAVDPKVGA
jgi:hypothetical protein